MKVLHLTSNDARTGGANALHRLHVSLLAAGVDSRVILGADEDKSASERHIPRSFAWRMADKPFGSMANMWAFTGGCTNSKGCERWMTGCGSCPILAAGEVTGAMLPMPRDLTAVQWKIKSWAFREVPMTVVAPSAWMAELVRHSPIMSGVRVECVPNPLDTAVFAPRDRTLARERLGLPLTAKVVFYIGKPGSVFAYEGRVPLLLEALRLVRVDDSDLARNMQLLIVGGRGGDLIRSSAYEGVALGSVNDERQMADCLSAADVMINTTQYDNLPGVVQEAMSCGTAVVASRVGGLPNMIDTSVAFARRDALLDAGSFDESLAVGEDHDMWARLAGRHRIARLAAVLGAYREHSAGTYRAAGADAADTRCRVVCCGIESTLGRRVGRVFAGNSG